MLLGDNDKIDFYDGESYMAKKLLTVCKTCPDYKVITSTGKYMLIHLSTDKPVESRFVFRYKQGKPLCLIYELHHENKTVFRVSNYV